MVYNERTAVQAALSIGYPVVIKPLNANHGRGVSINLTKNEQVISAFIEAKKHRGGQVILVESFVKGFDHRMLVVNNELVAVAKRVPGHVVGDGKSSIAELIRSEERRVGKECRSRWSPYH